MTMKHETMRILRDLVEANTTRQVTISPGDARSIIDAVVNEEWLGDRVRLLHAELDIRVNVNAALQTMMHERDTAAPVATCKECGAVVT